MRDSQAKMQPSRTKARFASHTVLEMATSTAIVWFNKGHKGFEEVLQELGILPTRELITLSNDRDHRMIKRISRRSQLRLNLVIVCSVAKKALLDEQAHSTTYAARQF